jgi:hypothetical protein
LEAGAGVKPRSPEWGAREQRGLDASSHGLQHAFMPSNVGPNSSRPNQKKTLDSDHGIYRDPRSKEDLPLPAPQKVLRAAMVAFEQSRQPSRGARGGVSQKSLGQRDVKLRPRPLTAPSLLVLTIVIVIF